MIIVPAILEKDKAEFLRRVETIEKMPGITKIQVDFCDGKFVKESSLAIAEIDPLNPTFSWEAHLMIQEPANFFDYQIAGFTTIIIHFEAFANKSLIPVSMQEIKQLGLKVGLAINPQTKVEEILSYQDLADQYTILSIQPGAQGRMFIPETISRIQILRKFLPNTVIEVDGGINETNIQEVVSSGADMAVVGSALKDGSFKNLDELQKYLM